MDVCLQPRALRSRAVGRTRLPHARPGSGTVGRAGHAGLAVTGASARACLGVLSHVLCLLVGNEGRKYSMLREPATFTRK